MTHCQSSMTHCRVSVVSSILTFSLVLSALPETRAASTLWLPPWRHSDAHFQLFRAFFDCFRTVFVRFRAVLHDFRTVFFLFFCVMHGVTAVLRCHRNAAMAAWRRHSANHRFCQPQIPGALKKQKRI